MSMLRKINEHFQSSLALSFVCAPLSNPHGRTTDVACRIYNQVMDYTKLFPRLPLLPYSSECLIMFDSGKPSPPPSLPAAGWCSSKLLFDWSSLLSQMLDECWLICS